MRLAERLNAGVCAPALLIPTTKFLVPLRGSEWLGPSTEKGVTRRVRVRGFTNDGFVRWTGWFDDRDDADEFLLAILTRSIITDRSAWRLPTPAWHPDFGIGLSYDFATLVYLTTPTGSNQTYTSASDWNNTNNSIETLGAGASGAIGRDTEALNVSGGGGGAWNKITNFTFATPGTTTATWQTGTGGASVTTVAGTPDVAGNNGGDTWFNGTTLGGSSVGSKGGSGGTFNAVGGSASGGAGGVGSSGVGTSNNNGGRGGNASGSTANNPTATGGGGAAGSNGAGSNGVDATSTGGSNGGSGDNGSGGSAGQGTTANGTDTGSAGGNGTEWDGSHGSGGGGGGAKYTAGKAVGGAGGNYGAGGGGAGYHTGSVATSASGAGIQGIIVLSYSPGVSLTGVSGTGAVGSPSITVLKTLTGVAGTGAIGTLVPNPSAVVSGVFGSGFAGVITPNPAAKPVGVFGTGQVGTISDSVFPVISGVQGIGQAGIIGPSTTLVGVEGVGEVGELYPIPPAPAGRPPLYIPSQNGLPPSLWLGFPNGNVEGVDGD